MASTKQTPAVVIKLRPVDAKKQSRSSCGCGCGCSCTCGCGCT